jgi:hypothetical protein
MRHSSILRALPWLLVALCPSLLGHCGGSVEHGTETGNPPVLEQQKLHIVLHGTGVELVGDPGAVPPGASVSITNRSTGEGAEATGRADGSLNVSLSGSLQDTYDVTVSYRGGTQTLQLTASLDDVTGDLASGSSTGNAGGSGTTAMAVPPTPDPLVCGTLLQTLGARVSAGFASADKTCQRDEDCENALQAVGCFYSCEGAVASRSGAEAARATIARDIAPLCTEFSSRGCELAPRPCPAVGIFLSCNAGTCAELSTLSCDELPKAAAARVTTAVNDTSRSCSRDADCALVAADISCVPSCGSLYYSVASSALEGLTNSVAQAEGLYCGRATFLGCPAPIALPCLPRTDTPQATCSAGQCEVTYLPLP